jgi:glycosyltransferase involved in cell wall biosynthesis
MQPTVSILIPTFNRPHFLIEAITSALSQTVHDIEVVIGDDGVLGRRVVREVGDPRVRYRANGSRLGIAGDWRRLLDSARGDFVLLLMDDDRLEQRFLERCLSVFAADRELGVVFTNHTFAREDGSADVVRACDLPAGRHDHFAEVLVRLNPVAICAALWRAEIWPEVRPLPDTASADMVLFGRIADLGWPFSYIDEPLMRYRVHSAMYSAERCFREDGVRALESLEFRDRLAQRERDRRLAGALLRRAAAELDDDALAAARRDVRRAWSLGPPNRPRAFALAAVASNPGLAGAARRWARLRRVRRARVTS